MNNSNQEAMKTMNTMKSFALAAMMMMAMTASAATNANSDKTPNHHDALCVMPAVHGTAVSNQRGYMQRQPRVIHCDCRSCRKARKALDKHMRKHHRGQQNRMACRTCMDYSHQLRDHMEMSRPPRHHRR